MGIDGNCESTHEADAQTFALRCRTVEADAPTVAPRCCNVEDERGGRALAS